ncbi:MAG: thiol reductase thioredoxin [Alphaproteobacteria bacterium]|nr:thiol reductase thioredoxin [Alphaproteobacteria bacterium]
MGLLTQAVCPACGAANRIASGRNPSLAKCGKCRHDLSLTEPIDVDDDALARHLRLTRGPVLLDVWAPWCGPCRAMGPQFVSAAHRLAGKVRLVRMNSDTAASPNKLNVAGIPALILFDQGREIGRHAGAIQAGDLVSWVMDRCKTRSAHS